MVWRKCRGHIWRQSGAHGPGGGAAGTFSVRSGHMSLEDGGRHESRGRAAGTFSVRAGGMTCRRLAIVDCRVGVCMVPSACTVEGRVCGIMIAARALPSTAQRDGGVFSPHGALRSTAGSVGPWLLRTPAGNGCIEIVRILDASKVRWVGRAGLGRGGSGAIHSGKALRVVRRVGDRGGVSRRGRRLGMCLEADPALP